MGNKWSHTNMGKGEFIALAEFIIGNGGRPPVDTTALMSHEDAMAEKWIYFHDKPNRVIGIYISMKAEEGLGTYYTSAEELSPQEYYALREKARTRLRATAK